MNVLNFGFRCLWQDKEEAEELRMAKIMEEEKAQFSVGKDQILLAISSTT